MIGQILILLFLYLLGTAFIFLFYPTIPYHHCITSGLFWGALLNVFAGILLGLLGIYSWILWFLLVMVFLLIMVTHFHRKEKWKSAPWRKIATLFGMMAGAYGITLITLGGKYHFLVSTDSLYYIVYSSHIYNYGSIVLPGAGFFFRSHYGVSETMMHALAGFVSQPVLALWHPFLFATLYAFFIALFYDATRQLEIRKIALYVSGFVCAIWSATASMNWLNSFYIHAHLFAAFCILACLYFYQKAVSAESEGHIFGFLGSLALCGYGLSRSESPFVILMFLALMMGAKRYSRQEVIAIFYPPIVLVACWLAFLFFAYRFTATPFWFDERLLFASGAYVILLIFVVLWKKLHIDMLKWRLFSIVKFAIMLFPIILFLVDYPKTKRVFIEVLRLFFGTIKNPGFGVWNFHMIGMGILLPWVVAVQKPWRKNQTRNKMQITGWMIFGYVVAILFFGFVRTSAYSSSRWGDSGSRMISQIAPSLAFFISISIAQYVFTKRKHQ